MEVLSYLAQAAGTTTRLQTRQLIRTYEYIHRHEFMRSKSMTTDFFISLSYVYLITVILRWFHSALLTSHTVKLGGSLIEMQRTHDTSSRVGT
ncbi:unnamed protein product [Toxocara canis]|uniref:Gustatory receptor n=1 Tax=Toxocara canis TaxID=6265 RepID=A0A183UCU8_TOXCA|nr:unnamed protein product [Toxocara canis]